MITATTLVCHVLGLLVAVFDDGIMFFLDDLDTLVVADDGTLDADDEARTAGEC